MLKSTTWRHKKDDGVVLVSRLAVGLSLRKSQHFGLKAFLFGWFLSDFVVCLFLFFVLTKSCSGVSKSWNSLCNLD